MDFMIILYLVIGILIGLYFVNGIEQRKLVQKQVIENALNKQAKQIFDELDQSFYYNFFGEKSTRVDMPIIWYEEIKAKFVKEEKV